MNIKPHLFFLSMAILVFTACEKEKNETSTPLPDNLNGVFIINEGAYLAGNASISFLSSDSSYVLTDIFQAANGFPVGDILQSMTIYGNSAYLCVNNSQKVEVVSMKDFKKTAVILGANSPRYFIGQNDSRGFVSDWSTNRVYLVDLNSKTISDSIACGQGPEQMLISDNKLFICNSGGFSDDSTLTVADVNTLAPLAQIPCGVNPASIVKDNNGKLWVLCRGSLGSDFTPSADDPGGKLMKIDPFSLNVEFSLSFNFNEHPIKLTTNNAKDTLYFLNGSSTYTGTVYKMSTSANILPSQPFITNDSYALGIHPNGSIYTAKANFSSNSLMFHYSNDGSLLDSLEVGIGPNSFVFN